MFITMTMMLTMIVNDNDDANANDGDHAPVAAQQLDGNPHQAGPGAAPGRQPGRGGRAAGAGAVLPGRLTLAEEAGQQVRTRRRPGVPGAVDSGNIVLFSNCANKLYSRLIGLLFIHQQISTHSVQRAT